MSPYFQQQLQEGRYRPGSYRQFIIRDRKQRVISAAPFRDRVVHHGLMNLLEPIFDRSFIDGSYACRKGKGVHAAVDRYQLLAQKYRYVLKLDIRRYFPSIDHRILRTQLHSRIKDNRILDLLDRIIVSAPGEPAGVHQPAPCYFAGDDLLTPLTRRHGIPIGNLTSQIFANLYLDDFDHWLLEHQRAKAYIRYVDDMLLLSNDKAMLWHQRDAVAAYLAGLRLCLHPNKTHIFRTDDKVDVLGYKVSRTRRWLRNDNGHRFARKLRAMAVSYAEQRLELEDISSSVNSWVGHAMHGETASLRQTIFSEVAFCREKSRKGEQAG